jgi:hypothetical protein
LPSSTLVQRFELVLEGELEAAVREPCGCGDSGRGGRRPLALARRIELPRPLVLIVTGRNVDDALYGRILSRGT